jgi:AraC family transcriptional regulator
MQHDLIQPLLVNFDQERNGAYKQIFERSPIVSSMSVGWNDLIIAYDQYPPGEIPKILVPQHCLGIYTDMPSTIQTERMIDGSSRQEKNIQGHFVLVPANLSHQVAWNKPGGAITIAINPIVFAQTIYEVVDPNRIELLPQFATVDPFVYQTGIALKSALNKISNSSRLYAESLVNTLIIHLLENYSASHPNLAECIAGTLPQYKLKQIINYIYAYLDRNLSIKELASVVQMSPHYFSQLFKATTGITPYQYIIRCRVEQAKELLQQDRLSIAEIATMVGFADQSHLHRYFKRLMGITPKTFSQLNKVK